MPAWTVRCSMPLKLFWSIKIKTGDQPWAVSCHSEERREEESLRAGEAVDVPPNPVIFIDSQGKLC